jgi:hypothetical protein
MQGDDVKVVVQEDLEAMITNLEALRDMPADDQLATMHEMIGIFIAMRETVMLTAFQLIAGLPQHRRVEAFDVFIAGLRQGARDE